MQALPRYKPSAVRTVRALRLFATAAHRALVFQQTGALNEVLAAHTFHALPAPGPGRVNVSVRLAPVNPSDVNVVEGVYPNKPAPEVLSPPGDDPEGAEQVYVPGNEGVAEVTAVGAGVAALEVGDRVVFAKMQPGTWASARQVEERDVIRVDADVGEVTAATLSVNPPTALCMLREFVHLEEGDWVVQNGANSAVGQLVVQIAAQKGIRTLNFVRSREQVEHEALVKHLSSLGATHTHTYDELSDRAFVAHLKQLTGANPPRLLLNCVSGPQTTVMLRVLGQDAQLVSYGAMSKKPLALPTGMHIFRGLVARGFWMSRWYADHTREERETLLREVAGLKLKEPRHKVFEVEGGWSDEEAGRKVREVLGPAGRGEGGGKILLRVQDPAL
ncbi:NAD-binding protein [Fomitopsis schrenkii]|uniref:enoyl-[acyl-carrier-protein] reductase n=1 Tax=Fomitopsis schrenkii TaxID=2126942 RepID=S8F705_FOMSC|nr:NAD-binding protein [Fomitopsis schrenkii]